MSDSSPTKPLDAVAEALFEIRFETTMLNDLVIGRLSSAWPNAEAVRLPFADIPLLARKLDQNLASTPVLELHDKKNGRVIKLSETVISLHRIGKYPKWDKFKRELEDFSSHIATSLSGFKARRLGLRYINIFNKMEHGVSEVTDLPFQVTVANKLVGAPLLINYKITKAKDLELMVRAASRQFMGPGSHPGGSAVVDLDVYTPGNHHASTPPSIVKWADRAHTALKAEFAKFAPAGTHVP